MVQRTTLYKCDFCSAEINSSGAFIPMGWLGGQLRGPNGCPDCHQPYLEWVTAYNEWWELDEEYWKAKTEYVELMTSLARKQWEAEHPQLREPKPKDFIK